MNHTEHPADWTDADEQARRAANVDAWVCDCKRREQQRGRIVGTRIALAVTAGMWGFIGAGITAWIFQ